MRNPVGSVTSGPPTRGERVELILSQLRSLPTLPVVGLRLLEVTASSDSCAKDVVRIVESDASLTASILRMVRRADLGIRGKVITVDRAVVLLGFAAVRNMALSLQLHDVFAPSDNDGSSLLARGDFWRHSLAVACGAQLIAERTDTIKDPGGAFVCGLLHDIGKIALDACVPKSYTRVLDKVLREDICICDAERDLLGFDHAVAGKRLITHWKLPQAILECVWLHHQNPDALPPSVTHKNLVRTVCLADNLARQARIGFSGYQHVGPIDEQAETLGIGPDHLASIIEQIPEKMKPFSELLGITDDDSPALSIQALIEANRELGRTNSQLLQRQTNLEVRSACFETMDRFTRTLTGQDRVSDICSAAAETLQLMLKCDRAAAFVILPAMSCIQVASAGPSAQDEAVSIIDLDRTRGMEGLDDLVSLPIGRGIGPAPQPCRFVWRHAFTDTDDRPLWILPIIEADSIVGGVLLSASKDCVQRFLHARTECEAVSKAIGLAVSSARGRTESERMSEELLELNRRLNEAQAGLVQAQSISIVAQMAAGAAHELNNPLAVIAGRAQILRDAATDEDMIRSLDIINNQARSASQIVIELMEFAKPSPPEPAVQKLAPVLKKLSQYWQQTSVLTEDRITLTMSDPDLTVYADPAQLDQILGAVMANAVQAVKPESAHLHVNSSSALSDDKVRIVVEDNGVGMTREVLEHALDPFFSSRPAGRGRGLGLPRAYRFAEMNGGRLWLESTPNVKTTVTIELPSRPPSS